MPAGQVRGSARDTVAALKRIRAVQLRSMGLTYEAIAASLLSCDDHRPEGRHDCPACRPMYGSRASAKKAVDRALEQEYASGAETREAMRRHQLAQIDLLIRKKMPEAMGNKATANEAARVVLRALDRRARLLGLDAPARVQITTELDAQIAELAEQLGVYDPQEVHP